MDTLKSCFAVVGAVVVVVVTAWGVIKLMAKYGTQLVAAAKAANQHISVAIKKIA